MQIKEQHLVAPLLFVALFSLTFLFAVSYTSSSFTKEEVAMPDIFGPATISPAFDHVLSVIADNLSWSVTTAAVQVKSDLAQIPVSKFFGVDNYQFGQPRYTALESNLSPSNIPNHGVVLGAFTVSPVYAAGQ